MRGHPSGMESEDVEMKQEFYNNFSVSPDKTPNFVHPELPGFLHTRVFNNNFDISYGFISCAIPSTNMNEIFFDVNIIQRKVQPELAGVEDMPPLEGEEEEGQVPGDEEEGQAPLPLPTLPILNDDETTPPKMGKV